jgi:hypothetical protein
MVGDIVLDSVIRQYILAVGVLGEGNCLSHGGHERKKGGGEGAGY